MGSTNAGGALNDNLNKAEITATITSSNIGSNNGKNNGRGKNQNNPIIYESTTTMHTTTKTTVKVNNKGSSSSGVCDNYMYDYEQHKNNLDHLKSIRTEYFKRMCKYILSTSHLTNFIFLVETGYPCFKNGFLDTQDLIEDMDPKLGELIYTDQMPTNPKEIDRKSKWVQEAYGPISEKSAHKTQLLQLIEYNKIAIHENDNFIEQRTEIEIVICKLMRQRIMNDELKV